MNEEQIKEMAEAYKAKYIDRFKKVAEIAYIDGMQDAFKVVRQMLDEVWKPS